MNRNQRIPRFDSLEKRELLSISPIGENQLVNAASVGQQDTGASASALAVLEGGVTVAVYSGRGASDRDGVFLRLLDGQGLPAAPPQLVNVTTAGHQTDGSITALADGRFIAFWQGRGSGDREGVFARWYDGVGSPLTGEVLVNQTVGGVQSRPQVAIASDGTATFVWQGVGTGDFDGIFSRRFNTAGAALGNEVLINTTIAREQAFADIAISGGDTALVTWSSRHQDGSDWGVYAQRLSLDGAKLGSEFRVNTNTFGSQMAAAVAAIDTGFAVAWQSRSQDGDGWGAYAQQLDTLSGFVGVEFRLNEDAEGNQHEVALAVTGESTILAAWTDGKPNGSGWNVSAREVDLDAPTPAFEDEFNANSSTAAATFGHQSTASVATRGNVAVIAWTGDGVLDHDGVYLQRYLLAANLAPNLAPIPNQTGQIGALMEITVTATDENAADTLSYMLDADNSPAGATIEKISNAQALIRWMPQESDLPGPVQFRVLVVDNGLPALVDSEDFFVALAPVI